MPETEGETSRKAQRQQRISSISSAGVQFRATNPNPEQNTRIPSRHHLPQERNFEQKGAIPSNPISSISSRTPNEKVKAGQEPKKSISKDFGSLPGIFGHSGEFRKGAENFEGLRQIAAEIHPPRILRIFAFLLRCLQLRSCWGETRQRVSLSAWLETSSEAAWRESNCIFLLTTSATLRNTCQPLDSICSNGNMQRVLHGGFCGFSFFQMQHRLTNLNRSYSQKQKKKARHRQSNFHPDL